MPRMQPKLIARDLSLWTLMFAVSWAEARALEQGAPAAVSISLGVLASILVAGCVLYVHEAGHLIGSLATRSVVHYPTKLSAPLLFDFDVAKNDRRQFLAMSFGGYAGSVIAIAVILAFMPLDRLSGKLSVGLALLSGLVSLVLEGPTTWRVLRGGEPPRALLHVAHDPDASEA